MLSRKRKPRLFLYVSALLLVAASFFHGWKVQNEYAETQHDAATFLAEGDAKILARTKEEDLLFNKIVRHLNDTKLRYYVYDDAALALFHLRQRVHQKAPPTWKQPWGRRIGEYAHAEILLLEALERHPTMRTLNETEADFILVPIPIAAMTFYGNAKIGRNAIQTLFQKHLFQTYAAKHVFLSPNEFVFMRHKAENMGRSIGWTMNDYARLRPTTVVQEMDLQLFRAFSLYADRNARLKSLYMLNTAIKPMTEHTWSIAYSPVASEPEFCFAKPTYENFQNRSTIFFYHTTNAHSLNNSTQFRHAPVHPNVSSQLLQPSSIGWGLPKVEWQQGPCKSKFCLAIRGDNPSSRSVWRAVKGGCIPVFVADELPYFSPLYRSFWKLEYFSIFVNEQEFLQDPAGALNGAVQSLSEDKLRLKLRGLEITQRLILPDHPQSLFVQAFAMETIASWQEEYSDFKNPTTNSKWLSNEYFYAFNKTFKYA